MSSTNIFYVKRMFIILFVIFLTSIGCKNMSEDYRWKIWKPDVDAGPSPYHQKWQPLIHEIKLLPEETERSVILVSPLITDTDTISPLEIYDHLTMLNDSVRRISYKNSWYVLKLRNFSRYSDWACVAKNIHASDRVFFKNTDGEDSLLELKGENIYEQGFKEPVGNLFTFQLLGDGTLLFQFHTNEPTFLKEITFYAYTTSKYKPVVNYTNEVIMCIGACIILLFLYSLFSTQDVIYFVFILHSSVKLVQLTSILGPFVESRLILDAFYEFSTFTLLLLIPKIQYRWTRKDAILGLFICFDLVLNLSHLLFNVVIGEYYLFIFDMIIIILYVLYNYHSPRTNNADNLTRLSVTSIVFLITLAKINEHIFFFYLQGFLPSIIGFIMFGGILIWAVFFCNLINRFLLFRKTKRKLEIDKALSLQKEISSTVIKTQEEERKRISQDMHDELGGNLALLKIKIYNADFDSKKKTDLLDLISRASASARAIAYKLMPPYFAETDFKMLLFAHFNSLNEKGDMNFNFHFTGDPKISKEQELMIYRIIMEMAQNCLKHSHAKNVLTEFIAFDSQIRIVCADDGRGFPAESRTGIGMQSIYSRISYLRGTINVQSGFDGTKIEICIPLDSK